MDRTPSGCFSVRKKVGVVRRSEREGCMRGRVSSLSFFYVRKTKELGEALVDDYGEKSLFNDAVLLYNEVMNRTRFSLLTSFYSVYRSVYCA